MEVAPRGCNLVLPSCDKALSVLLIDDNPARAEIVESGLRDTGYVLLERLEGTCDLSARVDTLKPDVIVVSTASPIRDAIEDLCRTIEKQPRRLPSSRTARIRRRSQRSRASGRWHARHHRASGDARVPRWPDALRGGRGRWLGDGPNGPRKGAGISV